MSDTIINEKRCSFILISLVAFLHIVFHARAAGPEQIQWKHGPTTAKLGDQAQIAVPQGFVFADANDTRILMEALENPTSGTEIGALATTNLSWYCIFSFDETGYIRDDEKHTLDAQTLLAALKRGTEHSNVERRRRGWSVMTILGWEQQPRYNETTHNLEWAIRGKSGESIVLNHSTRLLGREGVMRVVLVTDPNSFQDVLPAYQKILRGFVFNRGNSYAEYRPGDKVAKYGLTALIVGGATAVAVKSGAAKWIGKVIFISFLAILGGIKKFFSKSKAH